METSKCTECEKLETEIKNILRANLEINQKKDAFLIELHSLIEKHYSGSTPAKVLNALQKSEE